MAVAVDLDLAPRSVSRQMASNCRFESDAVVVAHVVDMTEGERPRGWCRS